MECESSFDASESDTTPKSEEIDESPSPKAEERQTRKSIVNNENKPAQSKKVRRSRANRKNSSDKLVTVETKSPCKVFAQASPAKKSPFKESNHNVLSSRQDQLIEISNLDPNFNEEDLLITNPVKENRQMLFENYLAESL